MGYEKYTQVPSRNIAPVPVGRPPVVAASATVLFLQVSEKTLLDLQRLHGYQRLLQPVRALIPKPQSPMIKSLVNPLIPVSFKAWYGASVASVLTKYMPNF